MSSKTSFLLTTARGKNFCLPRLFRSPGINFPPVITRWDRYPEPWRSHQVRSLLQSGLDVQSLRIRQVRLQHGLDQVELSAALNVEHGVKLEQSDISEIERQVRSLKDYELDAISKVLDIDPIWLLRGDN